MNKLGLILIVTLFSQLASAQRWSRMQEQPNTLNTEAGIMSFDVGDFNLEILKSSQTVSKLEPKSAPGFDFTPGERMEFRDIDGAYHLGDINLRLKTGDGEWSDYSSAASRKDVITMGVSGSQLAAADLAPTFPNDIPLTIIRSWEKDEDELILRFTLKNEDQENVEIGSLGFPMIFNNILTRKSLDEAHTENVFFDPYIGDDAGYLQVVRLHGKGPVLLVLPEENAGFEAYNPLNDDPTPRAITFEGFHEWMVHSKAHAEREWKNATPWNEPTSAILYPGDEISYAFRLVTTPSVRDIEKKLIEENRPVAVGVPGYVLPQDVEGKLFLNYPESVTSIEVNPEGSLTIEETGTTTNGWKQYMLKGMTWGRSRVTVKYEDGLTQTINYKVIKSEEQVIDDFGNFLTTEQWYENADDPFDRSPSVISYDYEETQPVIHDRRAWIAGLGDEAGSGSWLAAMMKQFIQPDPAEIKKMERFIHETMWGGIQYNEGPEKYGVRKSMYYYEPEQMPEGTYSEDVNYNTWSAWSYEEATSTGRSYNYPHVTAAHWVMYRLSRFYDGLVTAENWGWYLENAAYTGIAMVEQAPHYAQFGQMEGTIFVMLLQDLKREGMTDLAKRLEDTMKKRADLWKSLNYPFGSEMPWDSTGQEEVYMWSKYFGYDAKAQVTLNAILAYMPTVPHWGYNGSARRYWDFLYGGKLTRIERQLHHYGSALNAIPVLTEYRENPDDLYLLRVGYGGVMGGIANITEDGFGPAAFHSYPSTLSIDGYSGDYGSGFLGYAVNTSSYLYQHPEFGWLGFGGNVNVEDNKVTLNLTTAARSKVFVAPAGVWIQAEAGKISSVTFDQNTRHIDVTFSPATGYLEQAYISIEHPGGTPLGLYTPVKNLKTDKGLSIVKLAKKETTIELRPN